jgi:hypothetical protein
MDAQFSTGGQASNFVQESCVSGRAARTR